MIINPNVKSEQSANSLRKVTDASKDSQDNNRASGPVSYLASQATTEESLLENRTQFDSLQHPKFNETQAEHTQNKSGENPSTTPAFQKSPSTSIDAIAISRTSFETRNVFASVPVESGAAPENLDLQQNELPEPFVGEATVDQEWLTQRDALFDDIRNDYQNQVSAARRNRSGDWWSTTNLTNDDGDRVIRTIHSFSANNFRDHYMSQALPSFDDLAQHYGVADKAALLENHPDVISIAINPNRSELEGPVLSGYAAAPAEQLAMMDIQLSDPDVQAIIANDDQPVPEPNSGTARAQRDLYGEQRYEQMVRYTRAMKLVRDSYSSAISTAQRPENIRGFLSRDTPVSRLANSYYGVNGSPVRTGENSNGGTSYRTTTVSGWYVNTTTDIIGFTRGGSLVNNDIRSLDLNDLPDLSDNNAIFFSPGVGWVTPKSNIESRLDWVGDVAKLAIVGSIAYISGGAATGFAAGLFSASPVAAAITGAALTGAASAAVSGAVYGNFDWDDVLKGAFTGALTAGLNRIAAPLNNTALGSVGTQIGTQGIVTEVIGGDFADGALNGLLSGVSREMLNNMNAAINSSEISGVERLAALQSARLVSSAVRIAGMDGHPGQLFAQEIVTGLVEHASEGVRDAAYELGLSGGQSAQDFFVNLLPSSGDEIEAIEVDTLSIQQWSTDALGNKSITFTDDGKQYRLVEESLGVVSLYAEGQTQPIASVRIGELVANNSFLDEINPSSWEIRLPSGRSIMVGAQQAATGIARRLLLMTPVGILATGLVMPDNATTSVMQLDADAQVRFVTAPGSLTGNIEGLVDGEWITLSENIHLMDGLTDRQRDLFARPYTGGSGEVIADSSSATPDLSQEPVELPGGFIIDPNGAVILTGQDLDAPELQSVIVVESRFGDILINSGDPPPNADHQAHHIIPQTDGRAENLLDELLTAGIDINSDNIDSPENLIWLPHTEDVDNPLGRTTHNMTMRDSYFDYLENSLQDVTPETFPDRMAQIREDLEDGKQFE